MKEKIFQPGDKISLQTKGKSWKGYVLPSHDPEIILLKLNTGYNIGIREREILDAKVIEKAEPRKKKDLELEKNSELPNVAMIITGGTISARLDPKTGGVISTDAEEILNIAPEMKEICNIVKIKRPFMKWSENMSFADWKKLAETCEKFLNDESIDGIIITHGTDFLHYTASALSFFMRNLNKPVALTYSQRSVDRGSTDASLNLISAAKYAISDIAEVALIGHENSSDNSCIAMTGTKVRKMHTSKRNAFKPINTTPLARITKENFEILREFNARDNSKKVKLDTSHLEKVALVQIYPGQDASILEYYEKEGYRGIILEVTGIGQVPAQDSESNWLPKIKKAIQNGMIICATPQTLYGRLNPNIYSAGRDLQKTEIIFLNDMLPETAFVKLGWILGHKKWDPKEKMIENISNEFNESLRE
jgi:glutamyl-tRNA(Gln) amidotransferase subunit D